MANQNNIPEQQEKEAHGLEIPGIVELFRIQLNDVDKSLLFISPDKPIEYLDYYWDKIPCKMTGAGQNSSGEVTRPKFTIVMGMEGYDGVFKMWATQGYIENSILTRYRIRREDVEQNKNAYQKTMYTFGKIMAMNRDSLTVECRSMLDGANFKLPARAFYPPEFPHVSLR